MAGASDEEIVLPGTDVVPEPDDSAQQTQQDGKIVPTTPGRAYGVVCDTDCIVYAVLPGRSLQIATCEAGSQAAFVAMSDAVRVTDESAVVVPFVNASLSAVGGGGTGFSAEVVDELPESGQRGVIYLVPSQNPEAENVRDEYLWTADGWEQVGSMALDLSGYVQTTDIDQTFDSSSSKAQSGVAVQDALKERLGEYFSTPGQFFKDPLSSFFQVPVLGLRGGTGRYGWPNTSCWFFCVDSEGNETSIARIVNTRQELRFEPWNTNVKVCGWNGAEELQNVWSFHQKVVHTQRVEMNNDAYKSGVRVATVNDLAPVGSYLELPEAAPVPSTYLAVQGQDVAIADYPELFDALGATYGGDGETTFSLPNMSAVYPSSKVFIKAKLA